MTCLHSVGPTEERGGTAGGAVADRHLTVIN